MEINTNFYGNPKISSEVSGYVNYNIGMEPDVSFTLMNKGGVVKTMAGNLEGDFAPWRGLLEGWEGNWSQASTCQHREISHCYKVMNRLERMIDNLTGAQGMLL